MVVAVNFVKFIKYSVAVLLLLMIPVYRIYTSKITA